MNTTSNVQPPANTSTRIEWVCDICERPIDDGDGYVTVNYADLHSYRKSEKAWNERMAAAYPKWNSGFVAYPLTELDDYPDRVPWHVWHRACDPDVKSDDYWIAVERIRAPWHGLTWSAHLLGKKWIVDTAWPSVLRRASKSLGGSVFVP